MRPDKNLPLSTRKLKAYDVLLINSAAIFLTSDYERRQNRWNGFLCVSRKRI